MKKYTTDQIKIIPFFMKDRCREDWYPEYKGKLAILLSGKIQGKTYICGKWIIEGRDFVITE